MTKPRPFARLVLIITYYDYARPMITSYDYAYVPYGMVIALRMSMSMT